MKFVCDRCGKKYATADDPAPGKVYKLKCKACGHLIVVRAQAGTSTALPAVGPAEASGPARVASPEIELDVEPAAPPSPLPEPADQAVIIDAPLPPEVATAIDAIQPVPAPPPPDKDELADFAAAAAEVMAAPPGPADRTPYVDLFADGITGERRVEPKPGPSEDPFVAAARASLPAGYLGSGAPDPFSAPPAEPPPPRAPASARKPPVVAARPVGQATTPKGPPLALIGGGVVVLLVIAVIAFTRGSKPEPAAPAPQVAARPERPAPAPSPPEPVPAPEPAKAAEPAPAPRPAAPPAAAEKKPEPRPAEPRTAARPAERRLEPPPPPRPEPKPEPRPEPPRVAVAPAPPPPQPEEKPEPRTEIRDVPLPDADVALTPEVVQKVIGANRKAFASCIAASAGTGVQLDGRKVALRLTVNSNGAVTYPTLDDVTLNSTEMGQCLKSAARLMIFPKFKGDPFHVEVPLTLSAN